MIRKQKEQFQWLEYEQLQPFSEVAHAIFFRDLNCREIESIETMKRLLGVEKLRWAKHAHGDRIVEASDELIECDGLITAERNVGLLAGHADCQIALIYDPIRNAIGNIHSGWRGSVKNIYANAINHFVEQHRSNPADLLVCIGPSLGPDKAEFVNHRIELPPEFLQFQVRENYFDFWQISKMQLISSGVLEKHIEIAGICSYGEENEFFSHRREKKTGRNGTVIALKATKPYLLNK